MSWHMLTWKLCLPYSRILTSGTFLVSAANGWPRTRAVASVSMSALGAPGRVPPRAPGRCASGSRRVRRPRARVPRVCPAGGSEDALQTAPLANGAAGRARVPATRHVVVLFHDVSAPTAAGLFSVSNLLQGRVDVWCRCVTAALYLSDDLRRDTVVSLVLSPPSSEEKHEKEFPTHESGRTRVVTVRGDEVEGLAPAETRVALLLQRATQHASLGALGELGREAKRNTAARAANRDENAEEETKSSNEKKSERNASRRRARWVAQRPGSAFGPVPGITVTDYLNLETCLNAVVFERHALGSRGPGSILLLDAAGAPFAGAEALGKEKRADLSATTTTTFVLGDATGITKIERELLMRRDGISTVALGPRVLLASHCIVLAHAALDNVHRT